MVNLKCKDKKGIQSLWEQFGEDRKNKHIWNVDSEMIKKSKELNKNSGKTNKMIGVSGKGTGSGRRRRRVFFGGKFLLFQIIKFRYAQ